MGKEIESLLLLRELNTLKDFEMCVMRKIISVEKKLKKLGVKY